MFSLSFLIIMHVVHSNSGTVAGVYVGMEHGMERIRGTRDWVISKSSTKFDSSSKLAILLFSSAYVD